MNGIELAREMALLGAECVAQARDDDFIDAHRGFALHADRWAKLGERMRASFADDAAARASGLFGLPALSSWLVLLCAAVEIHPEAAAAVSILAEDERVNLVTPIAFARLARAALNVPFTEALAEVSPGGEAERLGFLERAEPLSHKPLTQQPLRLSAAALSAVLGGRASMDPSALSLRREPPASGPGLDPALVAGAASLLEERGALCIRARSARAGRQLALDLASRRGEEAMFVNAGEEAQDAAEIGKLRGGLLIIDWSSAGSGRGFSEAVVQRLARQKSPLVVIAPYSAMTYELATVDVDGLDPAARRRIWALALGEGERARRLATRFGVTLEEARAAQRAARDAARLAGRGEVELDEAAIAQEVMAQGARRMGRMVTCLRTNARLEHLIVPPALAQTIEDIVSFHRATPRVRDELRLAERSPFGRGLCCLFAGPPGTGKTLAAQCLANALGLNLYRIDLSQVVSKYIGETEKALHTIFEEAESGHGVLLFDEADALFGKRSEVKDAHDRYANIEVGYLLQRVEAFEGVAILTTNLRSNIDAAFIRRLSFILDFPMPDVSTRRRLWEQSLPPRDRWDASVRIDFFVERFALSGGNIHNIGVAAAHLAAARADGVLRIEHLVRATYRELEKNGMSRSRETFGPLAVHLPPGGR